MDKLIKRHVFSLNPKSNGGESLCIVTEFFDNGDTKHGHPFGFFTNQKIELQSYSNSASLFLTDVLTPKSLRKFADELEKVEKEIIKEFKKKEK